MFVRLKPHAPSGKAAIGFSGVIVTHWGGCGSAIVASAVVVGLAEQGLNRLRKSSLAVP